MKNNADTAAFKQQQVAAILDSVPKKEDEPQKGGGGKTPPPPQTKRAYVHASQLCKSQKIRSLEELNKYVDAIRKGLISALGDNDELIVL